ncbi:MAG: hypothetical protein WCA06_20310 [Terrimicrobiaceae bacterium]
MKSLLAFAAAAEAATGFVVLVYPPIVVRLLFGTEIAGAGVLMSRIAGVSLVALGLACWPCRVRSAGLFGMLIYSSLVALYFIGLGVAGECVGKLLWPAAVVHVILTIFLAREWVKERRMPAPKTPH